MKMNKKSGSNPGGIGFFNRLNRRFSSRRAGPWAGRARLANGLRVGKPAIQQAWKPAVRKNRLVPAVGFENHEMPIRCRICHCTPKGLRAEKRQPLRDVLRFGWRGVISK